MEYTINLDDVSCFGIKLPTGVIPKKQLYDMSMNHSFLKGIRAQCEGHLEMSLEELYEQGASKEWINDYLLAEWLYHSSAIPEYLDYGLETEITDALYVNQPGGSILFIARENYLNVMYNHGIREEYYTLLRQYTPLWKMMLHNGFEILKPLLPLADIDSINESFRLSTQTTECMIHI